jgi:hypothetical protein
MAMPKETKDNEQLIAAIQTIIETLEKLDEPMRYRVMRAVAAAVGLDDPRGPMFPPMPSGTMQQQRPGGPPAPPMGGQK